MKPIFLERTNRINKYYIGINKNLKQEDSKKRWMGDQGKEGIMKRDY